MDIAAAVGKGKIGTLITLDPVSMTPKSDPKNYDTWINVYQEQSAVDYISTIPVAGNLVGALLGAIDYTGWNNGDTISTIGGQLGAESGAVNIPSTHAHGSAENMLDQAKPHLAQTQGHHRPQEQERKE